MKAFTMDSCLLLTGTPLQNDVHELWTLLNFVEPHTFSSLEEFNTRYGTLQEAEQVIKLHEELRPYMLRRVKEVDDQKIYI